jgi:LysM repeat protein
MKRCVFLFAFFSCCIVTSFAQSSAEIQSYISLYKQIALDQEKEYGIPASITLAQGILESAAGTSQLTVNTNNHFGIKALGGWDGPVYLAWDDEPVKSRFRKYDSAEESFRDHSLVLANSPRYRSLFQKSVYDYRAWAVGLQTAGYATSPNYAKALIGYIDAFALYALNGGVKLRSGKKVTITMTVPAKEEEEWQLDSSEISTEQEEVMQVANRYVVEINGVRCTILYPGQTLSMLSQKYDIPQQKLLEYNEVKTTKDINEGDVVFLASKRKRYHGIQDYYVTKEGDNFHSISQQFGIRMESLLRLNNKTMVSAAQPGEKLSLK